MTLNFAPDRKPLETEKSHRYRIREAVVSYTLRSPPERNREKKRLLVYGDIQILTVKVKTSNSSFLSFLSWLRKLARIILNTY